MATKWVPFTVHVRVTPARPGKRWEHLRALQKLAVLAYDELQGLADFQFAQPGGGQNVTLGDVQRRGGLGSFANGLAAKPQFGQTPAQLMITGFYQSDAVNAQIWSDQTRIAGGETWTGPGAHTADAVPTTAFNTEAKTVKEALEDALTTAWPAGTDFSIFRLDYAGVVFGDRGFHFPR